jgi:transglutaminase-like putative cysteine protease
MQAGAIFAVIVLTLANILPAGAGNTGILSAWNSPQNPWQSLQETFQTLFHGVQGGRGEGISGSGFNFFGSNLALGTNPNLPKVPILHYTLPSPTNDPNQDLITQTMGQYNESDGIWTSSASVADSRAAGATLPGPVNPYLKINAYNITVNQTLPGDPLFAPGSSAQSFSVASQTFVSQTPDSQTSPMPVKWTSVGAQRSGTKYTAVAYVSTATKEQLQQVPYPGKITDPNQRAQVYPSDILKEYLPTVSTSLPPIVIQDATSWTNGTTNMYDAATAIQDYLHSQEFHYNLDIHPSTSGQDPLVWFLSNREGFCTYFATAMVVMARELGMPSRIAMGFASGQLDSRTNSWVVLGTLAHVWPQIYFGSQYGWINFEPTSSFTPFIRGAGGTTGVSTPSGQSGASATQAANRRNNNPQGGGTVGHNTNSGPVNPLVVDAGLGFTLAILLSLLGLVFLASWWRLLYRGLSPIVAAFARIARLGAWAGVAPKRSQTPDEYVEELGRLIPGQRPALERLSHLYARERWGGGLPEEIAGDEVPRLYTGVRQSIAHRIANRLRAVPVSMFTGLRRLLVGKGGYNGADDLHERRV